MKTIASKTVTSIINRALWRRGLLWSFGLTAAMASSALRAESVGAEHYRQVDLISDVAGAAQVQDPDLVNPWGISFSSTSPFWVSDNGTGKSTLYSVTNDTFGHMVVTKLGLVVNIPGEGTPTGQLFNGTGQFHGDIFIFASEDGVISGWRPALGTNAEVLVTNPDADYKGITLAMTASRPTLLVANFRQGTVDAYDGSLNPVGHFVDAHAPSGYAPFNVQSIEGMIFVTFALHDQNKHDDVAGRGHGLIDVFDPSTGIFHRFTTGRAAGGRLHEINSPWGITLAPSTFGKHAGELLVGNFGSGTIMTFDADGKFRGLLKGQDAGPMVIDGLWALSFGNNQQAGSQDTLFFTAGPDNESHGLFGTITPIKEGRDQK